MLIGLEIRIIFKDGKKYVYKVTDKKIVWPSQVEYLTETIGLQTIKTRSARRHGAGEINC